MLCSCDKTGQMLLGGNHASPEVVWMMVYAKGSCKRQSRETGENGAVISLGLRDSKKDGTEKPWEDSAD